MHRKGTKLAKCTAAAARSRSTRTATCVFLLPAMNGPTSWLKLEAAAPNLRVLATGRTAAASPAGSRGVSGLTAELEATARRAVARPLQGLCLRGGVVEKFYLPGPPGWGSPMCAISKVSRRLTSDRKKSEAKWKTKCQSQPRPSTLRRRRYNALKRPLHARASGTNHVSLTPPIPPHQPAPWRRSTSRPGWAPTGSPQAAVWAAGMAARSASATAPRRLRSGAS